MREIKCDICGYKFKTFEKSETHYEEYEPVERMVTYPDPSDSNPAHLIRNYICDKCYRNLGEIIKEELIRQGEVFVSRLNDRIAEEQKKLDAVVIKLKNENAEIKTICDRLRSLDNLYDLSEDEIRFIEKYDHFPFRTYYLHDAIRIERDRKLNEKTVSEWLCLFKMDVVRLPKDVRYSDIVSIYKFRKIVQQSIVKNSTYEEIQAIIVEINKYIEEHKK